MAIYRRAAGVEGPQGPEGPEGPQGAEGPVGPEGPQGSQGPAGPEGAAGPQGVQGPEGPQGPAGPQGDQGPQGPQGEPGVAGAEGPAGPQGAQGPAGSEGPAGATGPAGPQGDVGPAGAQGVQGDTGPQGPAGPTGPEGPAGPTGPQGIQGETGPAGAQGPQGDTGPAGPEGPQGPAGAEGTQGIQGETGPAGPTGPEGPQGPAGATGPQGIQGETGPQGPQGVQGDTGPAGATGATGPGVPAGGTPGQVLIKWIGGDYDTVWSSPVIDNLADVTVTTPAAGQVLTYDSVTSQWINETPAAGGGSSNLTGLTDVTISSPAGGHVLKYNSSTSQWVNGFADASNQVGIFVGNATASTIPFLSVVHISGDVGFSTLVELASNDSTNGEKAIGVTNGSINSGAGGQVITKGYIFNVDTSAWSSGDILWLGTNGQITNVKPTNPTSLVKVGYVTIDSATTGQIYVDVEVEPKAVSVNDLSDATITSPTSGSTLQYSSAQSAWVNIAPRTSIGNLPSPALGDIETIPRGAGATQTSVSGNLYGTIIVAPYDKAVTDMYTSVTVWGTSTVTQFVMAIYELTDSTNDVWTLLASTANDTTKPLGTFSRALDATVNLQAGKLYALVILVGGATPTLTNQSIAAGDVHLFGQKFAFVLTSQTSLPSTITAPTANTRAYYVGLR